MPSELRHLIFQPAEVLQAVRTYHQSAGKPLPPGEVVTCAAEPDVENGSIRFRIAMIPVAQRGELRTPGALQTQKLLVVDGPALVAALILHCRDRGIPLPARAEKSLKMVNEQLCLVAKISAKRPDQPETLRL